MSESYDFERAWLAKFSTCLERVAGDGVRRQVMEGSESLSTASSREEVLAWSQQAMERLDALVEEEGRREIMTGCACQYSKAGLQEARQAYQETQDIGLVHGMLQAQFEAFLTEGLELDGALADEVVARGWGLAGVRQGDRIIATKIPKSGFLVEYMEETDPQRKREYYCHCPRIRDVLQSEETLSTTYCYCGAGYYQGIWEEILGEPVEVELLESVLQGDEVCKVAIHLPGRVAGDVG